MYSKENIITNPIYKEISISEIKKMKNEEIPPLVRSFYMLMSNFHQIKDLFLNPCHFQPNKNSKNIKGKKLW
jgi:hypothetical protein